MAKLRERNDQIEIILERRHVVLLGLCAIVLGSLLFLLGMLTQRNWLSGSGGVVAEARRQTPPPLFPNRSSEPTVRSQDFEFYESLTGAQAKDRKALPARREEAARAVSVASEVGSRSAVPAVPAVAKTKEEPKSPAVAKTKEEPKSPAAPEAKAEAKPAEPASKPAAAKAEPAAAQPQRPSLKADKNGAYALQVAALSDRTSAQEYSKRLKAKGYPAFVDRARINGRLVFRVKVGNYGSRDKAQQVASKLEAEVGKQVLLQRAAEG